MFKSHFDDLTVSDILTLLKKEYPQLSLDISCFMNELVKENELMTSSFEDVLSSYDSELFRKTYYSGNEPTFIATSYYRELHQAVKEKYPNEYWVLSGDYQITYHEQKNREAFNLYEDEKRKAQFTSKDEKKLLEVEYKCLSNHKTDSIEIIEISVKRG